MNSNLAYVYDEDALVDLTLIPATTPENTVALFEQYETAANSAKEDALDDTCCNLYMIPA